jgi:hypothetical protein
LKKHLFRIIAVLSAAVLLAGCAASRLRLGAAAAGGVYNAFGIAMSAQNSTIEVKQTAGSAANLDSLAEIWRHHGQRWLVRSVRGWEQLHIDADQCGSDYLHQYRIEQRKVRLPDADQ